MPVLLSFTEALEARQQEAIAQLGKEALGLLGWAWQRRTILGAQPKHLLETRPQA